jgi:type VII secretion integral membrane protein EccD
MSQAVTAGTLVRVSVVSEDRRLDIGVPASVPLIEIIPGFARSLGVLDPTLAHGGYALHRADGSILDPARSAGAQGVHDGELLTLVRGGLIAEPRIYDDVVEAVIDATSSQHGVWSPQDSARTALAISLSFLALCALLLLTAGSALGIGAFIAAGGTVVLIATAAVLTRIGQPEAGHALGLAGAMFGGRGHWHHVGCRGARRARLARSLCHHDRGRRHAVERTALARSDFYPHPGHLSAK